MSPHEKLHLLLLIIMDLSISIYKWLGFCRMDMPLFLNDHVGNVCCSNDIQNVFYDHIS